MCNFFKRMVFFLTFILFFTSCNRSRNTVEILQEKIIVENFDFFYNKFHSDSLFQMGRIKFPLKGQNVDGLEKTNWTKENWNMLRTKIYDIDTTQFKINFKKTKTSFFEKCVIKESGFSSEFGFKLIGKKWYLVYALDKNL
jgi:hypothetical protein